MTAVSCYRAGDCFRALRARRNDRRKSRGAKGGRCAQVPVFAEKLLWRIGTGCRAGRASIVHAVCKVLNAVRRRRAGADAVTCLGGSFTPSKIGGQHSTNVLECQIVGEGWRVLFEKPTGLN
jgi:hypothetical protein